MIFSIQSRNLFPCIFNITVCSPTVKVEFAGSFLQRYYARNIIPIDTFVNRRNVI